MQPNLKVKDLGPLTEASVDYPEFAHLLCEEMKPHASDPHTLGVLICGSGQGMAIAANRHSHIRAALCWSVEVAKLSRSHNNANVLCLPSRFVTDDLALEILNVFLSTEFEGGRHERRVAKITPGC